MSIKLHLCNILSYHANSQSLVEVRGNTVGECLNNLAEQFPSLKYVIDTNGSSVFIRVFVHGEDPLIEELTSPVKDGDEFDVFLQLG